MNRNYYAPENFKKGRLYFSKYRLQDLLIVSVCSGVSILAGTLYLTSGLHISIPILIILMLPLMVSILLVIPTDVYHNLLMYIILFLDYLSETKKYIWGGLIKSEEQKENSKE